MRTHSLADLQVGALGIGCMPMSGQNYGPSDEAEAIRTIHHALDNGVTLFDTAETYGHHHANEELLGKALATKANEAIVGTKFGLYHVPNSDSLVVDSDPKKVKASCEGSLRRLGVEAIGIYYQHRVDPTRPIEETWLVLADLVREGKVLHLGMSEPGLETLRRAHAIHPVTAVQNEYSLLSRDPENGVLATLRELGIGLVPFAPLGRGFLSGAFRQESDFEPNDFRKHLPRFQGDNLGRNVARVDQLVAIAAERGLSGVQLGLSWLLAQGKDIVPIPGVETVDKLDELLEAEMVDLSKEEVALIGDLFDGGGFGARTLPADIYANAETPQ